MIKFDLHLSKQIRRLKEIFTILVGQLKRTLSSLGIFVSCSYELNKSPFFFLDRKKTLFLFGKIIYSYHFNFI